MDGYRTTLYKWHKKSNQVDKVYSICDYTSGIYLDGFTNKYEAKRAFKDAVKKLRVYHQHMNELRKNKH